MFCVSGTYSRNVLLCILLLAHRQMSSALTVKTFLLTIILNPFLIVLQDPLAFFSLSEEKKALSALVFCFANLLLAGIRGRRDT